MAFKEVTKTPNQSEINQLKRQYKTASKKFEDAKYRFKDSINWDDFETLSVSDFLQLKELYITQKKLYWKIHQLEHPEDKATKAAYDYLNSLDHNAQIDFLASNGLTTHKLIQEIERNPNFIKEVTA